MMLLGVIAALVGLALLSWAMWSFIGPWFSDSETLYVAWMQKVGGVLMLLLATDLTPVFHALNLDRYAGAWVLLSGIIVDLARRSRAPELNPPTIVIKPPDVQIPNAPTAPPAVA